MATCCKLVCVCEICLYMKNVPTCSQMNWIISFSFLLAMEVQEGDEKRLILRWGVQVLDDSIIQQGEAMTI